VFARFFFECGSAKRAKNCNNIGVESGSLLFVDIAEMV
jgi:hypothetical protein